MKSCEKDWSGANAGAKEAFKLEVFYDFVKRLIKGFEKAGLDYAFTGALAASFYGVPRTTVDVDVLVYVSEGKQKARLVAALRWAELTVDEGEIEKALKSGYRIATFKDCKTPYSVDVIISNKKFEKKAGKIAGLKTFFQTPEDLVLAKLRMIKATIPRERALKDMDDVRAILKFTRVDLGMLKKRARKENTLSTLETLMEQ
ncbi:MAG: hypothetical protein QXR76_06675 [Candidatus Bathyarchaeia archaeon]